MNTPAAGSGIADTTPFVPVKDSLQGSSPPPAHSGPYPPENPHGGHQSFWLWVMCLTGVDYFSTLGYQPSIAFEAAGILAPIATVVLVLITLFGALPVYRHVASQSPHGQGSIAMLEHLVHGWKGKALVLILLGFAATDFVITKTLSAADAAVHIVKNPYWMEHTPSWMPQAESQQQLLLTMFLLVLLGASFMRGFREVIGAAVVIVGFYLALNALVIGSGLVYLLSHPGELQDWFSDLAAGGPAWHIDHIPFGIEGTGLGAIAAISLLIFPKLALGLSGFETGVAVMPLIQGEPGDDPQHPAGRIRNTRKLLATAAIIMSVYLLGSALVTSTLIAPEELLETNGVKGRAADRALAYIAHGEVRDSYHGEIHDITINPLFGETFGTIYDIATVAILAFAGASAMAGLLNLVPQYLPRYGMAPEWARAVRPLVCLFTVINLLVTWIFSADVKAQGGAYATGVLMLITSACMATIIDRYRASQSRGIMRLPFGYVLIGGVFLYTTTTNIIEKPDGIKIASCFIAAIIFSSFYSRLRRSTELRFRGFEYLNNESKFMWDSLKHLEFPVLVPHRPGSRGLEEKEQIIRRRHRLPPDVPIVFIEAELGDPSEFQQQPLLEIKDCEGKFIISVKRCVSIAHVIATLALELSHFGKPPEVHFGWSDENPMAASIGFLLLGEGNVPWMVRELIRKAEPDRERRPKVFIG